MHNVYDMMKVNRQFLFKASFPLRTIGITLENNNVLKSP